jgi:endonuclease-3
METVDRLADKAQRIHDLLLREYGPHPWRPGRDPLAIFVSTIISQNTSDVNRDRAFDRLRQSFPTWEEVRQADIADIAEAIKPAGLHRIKAPRIKEALQAIHERRGELSLDFLADMEAREARDWLTSINGIGPKTAAIVLCFAFGKPAFPVDTHVHRVTRRLGLIGPKTSREKAQQELEAILPAEIYYTFHLNLIAHGRQVCRARQPRCEICVLQELCDYFRDPRIRALESRLSLLP